MLGTQPTLNKPNNKRKADASPKGERIKRSALGNLTNANASNVLLNDKNINTQKTYTKNNRAITTINEEEVRKLLSFFQSFKL